MSGGLMRTTLLMLAGVDLLGATLNLVPVKLNGINKICRDLETKQLAYTSPNDRQTYPATLNTI